MTMSDFSFLGISIISDILMTASDKIFSKKKPIFIATGSGDGPQEAIEVNAWNGSVGPLILMSIGKAYYMGEIQSLVLGNCPLCPQ